MTILWIKLDFLLFVWQFFMIYLVLRLILTTNFFKKLFIILLFLVSKALILGYYQIEVFGWFLVLNELAVGMVLFLILLYSNYPHTTKEQQFSVVYYLGVLYMLSLFLSYHSPTVFFGYFGYIYEWVDYYKALEPEALNDLVGVYYMYYFYYPNVLILVSVFLFLLSVIYLYSTNLIMITEAHIYKKDNNVFQHTLKQPSFSRFKISKNDL